jgi:two-component system response regulator RegA
MPKLLLVDDSDSNRVTLSVLLEEEGFSLQTADSFAQARQSLGGGTVFDAVLLDQNLGDGRGTDLIPLIRERMPDAKVLLISGSVREDLVPTDGLDGFVAKGAAFPDVLELVRKALAGR